MEQRKSIMGEFERLINEKVERAILEEGTNDLRVLENLLHLTTSLEGGYFGAAAVFQTFMINFAFALNQAQALGMGESEGIQSALVVAGSWLATTAGLFQETSLGDWARDNVQEKMPEALKEAQGWREQ